MATEEDISSVRSGSQYDENRSTTHPTPFRAIKPPILSALKFESVSAVPWKGPSSSGRRFVTCRRHRPGESGAIKGWEVCESNPRRVVSGSEASVTALGLGSEVKGCVGSVSAVVMTAVAGLGPF